MQLNEICACRGKVLTVVDTLGKACYLVLGCRDLIVVVDHKPLLNSLVTEHLMT